MQTNENEYGTLYLAGEYVSPGTYKQVGGSRELRLEQRDYLPASLDGQVACYERVEHTWEQICSQLTEDATLPSVFQPGSFPLKVGRERPYRVLICTDSGILAIFLRHTLEQAGYVVIGKAAESPLSQEVTCRPDLILMDISFCENDGLRTAEEITDSGVPILLMGDQPMASDFWSRLPGGVYDYLYKPFTGAQLVEAVDRLMALFRIVRDEFELALAKY